MILGASLSLRHFEKLSYRVNKNHWISEKAHDVEWFLEHVENSNVIRKKKLKKEKKNKEIK